MHNLGEAIVRARALRATISTATAAVRVTCDERAVVSDCAGVSRVRVTLRPGNSVACYFRCTR